VDLFRKFNIRRRQKRGVYEEDAIKIGNRNLSFLSDPRFAAAWASVEAAFKRTGDYLPEVRWRLLICLQAARIALNAEGDFVECGTNLGIFSNAICHDLDFGKLNRRFFLFDTFAGIPAEGLTEEERKRTVHLNDGTYSDCFAKVKKTFENYTNVELVRGKLPDTLSAVEGKRIAFLSIDLNSATYEMQVMRRLWDQLSASAVVVVDDYGFKRHEAQYDAWNEFSARSGAPIIYSPTGQGIIFKSVARNAAEKHGKPGLLA